MALDTIEVARAEIAKIYIAAFNRVPDAGGLSNWMNQYMAGVMTYEQIAEDFTNQTEYTTKYPSIMTNTEYVTAIYENVFGREPDAGGLVNWVNQLDATSITGINRGNIMTYMLASAASNTDGERLDNQASFAIQSILSGVPEATATAQLANITSDHTTVTTATAAVAGEAGATQGQVFNLTTSIDSVSGTSGNDTINAALDAGAATFTSLDSINGGAGNDKLNIVMVGGTIATAAGATVTNVETVNLVSTAAITAADISGWTGVDTLNVTSTGAISGVVAAATTDINVANGLSTVTTIAGHNVTVHSNGATAIGTNGAGAVTTAAAGNVTVVDSTAGAIEVAAAGTETVTSKDSTILFINGTAITANAKDAVSAADIAAHTASKAATAAAKTAAGTVVGTNGTDAIALASIAATNKATALTTLQTAITTALTVSADQTLAGTIGVATKAALTAGAITLDQKVSIDAAYATGLVTSGTAAQTAALAIVNPLLATANADKTTAQNAQTANIASTTAADTAAGVLTTADTTAGNLVDGVVVTATTNTALTTATINGNYGSVGNAVTDGSTVNNTLTTVTLNHAGATTLTGKALANVNLTDQTGTVTIVNSTANNTLNVSLNNVNNTLDVSTGGGTSTTLNLALTGTNTITSLAATATTALNITGAGNLTSATALTQAAAVIDASAATGNITTAVTAGQTYTGGSGVDTITAGAALQTKTVDGGAGSADKLIITNAAAIGTTGAAKFSNFEVLQANNVTVDLSTLTNSAITSEIALGGATLNGLTATQAANVTVRDTGALVLGVTGATTVGHLDTVHITVDDATTGVGAVGAIVLATPSLAGIETLNLTANDGFTIGALTDAAALTNVNVTGAGSVSISSGALALNVNTVIDASADNSATTLDFHLATANGVSLKAGNGNNTLLGTDIAGHGNTITSGNGNSTITGGQADDIITAGNGNNTIHAAAGSNTITVGNGNNTIDVVGSAAANTIIAGNGINVITGGSAADTITVGTGYNLITGGAGADTITFGTHATGVIDGIVMSTAGQTWTGAAIVSGTTALTGVDVVTGLHAGDTINLVGLSNTYTGALATTIAGATATTAALVQGSYDTTTGIFTASTTGTDSMVTYDADAAAGGLGLEAIILVGYHGTADAAAGVITLA